MENAGGSLQASSYRRMRHADTAKRNIANAVNITKKILDPAVRGELIAKVEAAVETIKTDAPWTPFVPEETEF
jgi:hypothetical protein